jgi:porphobilinogen synthase
MYFPSLRLRRLRKTEELRRMFRETTLGVDDLIYPMFSTFGKNRRAEISSMPGIFQLSIDEAAKEAREAYELGIPAVILFGIPHRKDERASGAYAARGVVQETIKAIKAEVPKLVVITDVCLCEYMSHGHCGIVKDGEVENDSTLELLKLTAVSHAMAGADMVAPSDMMDGRVRAIREGLDKKGYTEVPIMAYSAKYASGFYGPFREAAESAPKFGDRRSYQMDPPNAHEAMREVMLDIEEGADIVMVKPALAYLDIIARVREETDYPVAAYSVSGEYSMIKAADRLGWVDGSRVMMEVLTSIKRAGASVILTYFAKEAARLIKG